MDFSQPQAYTPKFLADRILTSKTAMEGERKLITVLFADVAGYTAMSEKLDPEVVHQIMDGCFRILMDEIHKYEGTINQFTGDGVMALFGAPVACEDHAQRACQAALAIQEAMGAYAQRIRKETGLEFKLRIGLNTGPVIVGSIGDDLRMDYTAVGDTTNLASRLQGLAAPATTLASRDTHRLARNYFEFRPLGRVGVKGKAKPQEAFELLEGSEAITRLQAAAARLDRLEEDLKRTMQVASVIGREFAFRILQTITGMREELKHHLLNLQGLEFIYEKQLFPELEYIFKHALTQEVAYNSLLVRRRSEIHRRIGEAVETLYPERLEEFYEVLAYHYSKSDEPAKAHRYLRRTGRGSRLPVWTSVSASMASSRVPNPPGRTTTPSASLTKASLRLKKYL